MCFLVVFGFKGILFVKYFGERITLMYFRSHSHIIVWVDTIFVINVNVPKGVQK